MNVWFLFGYMNTGSSSLTFPEDFELLGVYESEQDARDEMKRLNDKSLQEEGIELEDDEDIYDLECGDFMVYEVYDFVTIPKK